MFAQGGIGWHGQYLFDDIDTVLYRFLAQYPLSKIKNNSKYQHKVHIQFALKDYREEIYDGTVRVTPCQDRSGEWDKIVITLYYSFSCYPEIDYSFTVNESSTTVLYPSFLSECKMDTVKDIATEIGAERVKCYYNREQRNITVVLCDENRELCAIRLRPGEPIDDEKSYCQVSDLANHS